ncbi:MAG: S-layer homology domain-containing protein [Anaerolineales bacterium]|nr:S-layer homology domain-containing protein [Anaerolineales bacterium]
MSKKIFTVLLLAVFMLAQFSIASAAVVAGDASITAIPDFANAVDVDIDWAVTGMAGPSQNILIWSRIQNLAVPAVYSTCLDVATIIGTSDASGTFTYVLPAVANGDVVEFLITVESTNCAGAVAPLATEAAMGETTVDSASVRGFYANPPYLDVDVFIYNNPVACNTWEMWGVVSDDYVKPLGYSGFGKWNPLVSGTFAPPAPVGADDELLSWPFTFPSTASDKWAFTVWPEDAAGNKTPVWGVFRDGNLLPPVSDVERADCVDFSDTAGTDTELYVRYLASLDLISGFADGTYGSDLNLTRAEASALFEKANGYDDTMLPATAPAGCEFTDVTASDWFAGWVWQACDDGFMNGVGGGLFDPNNLLTRGQVVTIFNNIQVMGGGAVGSYLDFVTPNSKTVLDVEWNNWGGNLRYAAFTDVSVGAYYAYPVLYAYEVGVADGTSATTFSPDQAATRGEFAKMLYRALSRVANW